MALLSAYFVLGFLWAGWLEWFTTSKALQPEWDNRQRIVQILIWPIAFTVFLIYLFFPEK